jgi:hypothetical protein
MTSSYGDILSWAETQKWRLALEPAFKMPIATANPS